MLDSESADNYQAKLAQVCSLVVKTGNQEYDPKYEKLLAEVVSQNLFARDYLKYFLLALFAGLGLIMSVYILWSTDLWYYQVLNGIFFAFFSVQFGIMGHDLSHGAVFKTKKYNRLASSLIWPLIVGFSEKRWFEKHNDHHIRPNQVDHDPDLEMPYVFSKIEIQSRSAFVQKYIIKRQHYLFWLFLPLLYLSNIFKSFNGILSNSTTGSRVEIFLIFAHYLVVLGGTFYLLPTMSAVAFLLAMFFTVSLYMSLIFAPNHKGEEIIASETEFIWENQITTTRNIKPSLIIFYLQGGLSLQIEHHLFPNISRYKLMKVRTLVKQYCQDNKLTYNETTWIQSMKEIHHALKEAQG
jgi:fatty acid desaturase